MFRLNRNRPLFTRAWFLSIATVASMFLGVTIMAATDTSASTPQQESGWTTTISTPGHMEMTVRVPRVSL